MLVFLAASARTALVAADFGGLTAEGGWSGLCIFVHFWRFCRQRFFRCRGEFLFRGDLGRGVGDDDFLDVELGAFFGRRRGGRGCHDSERGSQADAGGSIGVSENLLDGLDGMIGLLFHFFAEEEGAVISSIRLRSLAEKMPASLQNSKSEISSINFMNGPQ